MMYCVLPCLPKVAVVNLTLSDNMFLGKLIWKGFTGDLRVLSKNQTFLHFSYKERENFHSSILNGWEMDVWCCESQKLKK